MFKLPSLRGGARKSSRRASKPSTRRKLRLEGLETRDLLSAIAIVPSEALITPPNAAPATVAALEGNEAVPNVLAASQGNVSATAAGVQSKALLRRRVNVKRFDGSYTGTFTGTVDGQAFSGNLSFTVFRGVVRLTSPGKGSAKINAKGNVSFSARGLKLKGHFTLNSPSATACGRWTLSRVFHGITLRGRGTWSASRA